MNQLLNIFSTREIAVIIWGIILLIGSWFIKGMPQILSGFLKIIGSKIVILLISISAIYTALIVILLWKLCLWDITFLKDTCIWFLFSSISITFNVNKARNFSFFKNIIRDNISIILIFEFIINFYTFSLPVELIVIPIISFIVIIQGFAEVSQKQEPDHQLTASCLKKIIALLSVSLFIFVLYKTMTDYEGLFTIYNLKSFLLPINLTLLFLPFFYGLALYMEYETLFKVMKQMRRYEPSISKKLIRATLLYANVNINKLSRIWKHHSYFNPAKENPYNYIKRIANKPQYVIGTNAKLSIFNNVEDVIKNLSNCGLGELEEWMEKGGDYYFSSSSFYQFKSTDKGITDNSMQYLLSGEKSFINQIDVMLNIGLEQDFEQALITFRDLVVKTFNELNITIHNKLLQNIGQFKNYNDDFDNYSIKFECTKFQKIGWCTLSIISKLYDDSN
jgi:hypothetical protein